MFLKYEKMSLKLLNADESNHICKCYWKPKGKERKIAISLSLSLPLLLPASNNFFFFWQVSEQSQFNTAMLSIIRWE